MAPSLEHGNTSFGEAVEASDSFSSTAPSEREESMAGKSPPRSELMNTAIVSKLSPEDREIQRNQLSVCVAELVESGFLRVPPGVELFFNSSNFLVVVDRGSVELRQGLVESPPLYISARNLDEERSLFDTVSVTIRRLKDKNANFRDAHAAISVLSSETYSPTALLHIVCGARLPTMRCILGLRNIVQEISSPAGSTITPYDIGLRVLKAICHLWDLKIPDQCFKYGFEIFAPAVLSTLYYNDTACHSNVLWLVNTLNGFRYPGHDAEWLWQETERLVNGLVGLARDRYSEMESLRGIEWPAEFESPVSTEATTRWYPNTNWGDAVFGKAAIKCDLVDAGGEDLL